MGKAHALSGAATWLAGAAAVTLLGADLAPAAVYAGAAVSAGMALAPDFDHPNSTATRTLGPITGLLHSTVEWIAVGTRYMSCRHCRRRPDWGGHRGLTHTTVGAVLAGLAVMGAVAAWGWLSSVVVVGFAVWLLVHAALSARTRARIGDLILPGKFRSIGPTAFRAASMAGAVMLGAAAGAAVSEQIPPFGWWWLGLAVTWGCLAHSLGDALTFSAVPLLWPLQIGGCRWTSVGVPRWMRFRTGSRAETAVMVVLALLGVVSVAALGAAT